jgi:hypothetical protein
MAAYAEASDVAARFRPLTTEEALIVPVLLEDASNLLRATIEDLDDEIADGDIDAELVKMIVCNMVIRVLKNPTGATQGSQTAGPFTISTSYDEATRNMYPLDWELQLLGEGGGAFDHYPYFDTTNTVFG